jgi:hypothetical protein
MSMKSNRAYFCLTAVVFFSVLVLGCSSSSTAPKEIQGTWRTGSPESAGVSIEFTPDKIIISSDFGVVENTITKVKSQKGHLHNSMLYSVYYSDRFRETNLMNVLYSPEDGGVLRFKSEQDVLWKRSG